MGITVRHRGPARTTHLIEIVTPRTNAALITLAEHLFANVAIGEPFGVEIAATATTRRFLLRVGSAAMAQCATARLRVAYPQAELRVLDVAAGEGADPATRAADENLAASTLAFRRPAYLPIRTWPDVEVDAARAAGADPILGVLGATGGLPPGWRAVYQLLAEPLPAGWARRYLHMALEQPLAAERRPTRDTSGPTAAGTALPLGGLGAAVLAWQIRAWYEAGDWLRLGQAALCAITALALLVLVLRFRGRRPVYDPALVAEKIARPAYRAQLRLLVFAPAGTPAPAMRARLGQLAAAFHQCTLAAGNGFAPRSLRLVRAVATGPQPVAAFDLLDVGSPGRSRLLLNTRELAGLWHLPQAGADVPYVERTGARRRRPRPAVVAAGCRVGVAAHQGQGGAIALPDDLLRGNLLLVAKTRMGKSSLLLHLARYLMARDRALLLVAPTRTSPARRSPRSRGGASATWSTSTWATRSGRAASPCSTPASAGDATWRCRTRSTSSSGNSPTPGASGWRTPSATAS
ncbi:MAG TPA: hypothetical protein VFW96_26410 [Thermomicrobiales bacterium]|nr:hypothetical protein [Thermomicrobiales bacterium]